MNTYSLIRIGRLWATRAALTDKGGSKVLTLLIDTGATYTIIPVEILESIGQSAATSREHVKIVTGNGVLMVPRVTVAQFHCVGQQLKSFSVVGHTLPPAGPIDGLLGMDFLHACDALLDLTAGTLTVRRPAGLIR